MDYWLLGVTAGTLILVRTGLLDALVGLNLHPLQLVKGETRGEEQTMQVAYVLNFFKQNMSHTLFITKLNKKPTPIISTKQGKGF